MAAGDVYEKVSGAWVPRGNLTGPTGPMGPQGVKGDPGPAGAATAIRMYKRAGFSGSTPATAGALWFNLGSFNTMGGGIVVISQMTISLSGNARTWVKIDGNEIPGRLWYYPGYGSPETMYGAKVITALAAGAHTAEIWGACSVAAQIYDDAVTTPTGPGDTNASFFSIYEFTTSGFVSPVVSALPSTPFDGQEITLVVDAANFVYWRMKWVAAAAKWIFVGGQPIHRKVTNTQSITGTAFADIGGSGDPSCPLPAAGMYDIQLQANLAPPTGSNAQKAYFAYDGSGQGAADTEAVVAEALTGQAGHAMTSGVANIRRTHNAGSIFSKGRVTGGSAQIGPRSMRVLPVYLA